jgi:tetratricopeptide (TPR) repeat protein
MRILLTGTFAAAALTLAMSFSAPVLAEGAADPTVHQIYEAAEAGRFDQAQQMMDQVLKDHPKSAKAHYVQAELYAKEGKTALARAELAEAEGFDPGLTHENPRSVQALKSQLGVSARPSQSPRVVGLSSAPAAPHFPWGTALIFVVVIGLLWMMFRRRSTYSQYPAAAATIGRSRQTVATGGRC